MTKKSNRTLRRQGDLLFVRVDELPAGAESPVADGILARGEATGHAHRLNQARAMAVMIGAALYVRALERVEVLHEEHGPVALDEGLWRVDRQRTYEPDGWRQVAD